MKNIDDEFHRLTTLPPRPKPRRTGFVFLARFPVATWFVAVTTLLLMDTTAFASQESSPPTAWPTYQFTASHNAVFRTGPTFPKWTITLGGKVGGSLALVGDNLYVDSFDHRIYDISPSKAKVKWSVLEGNVLMSTPIVSHNVVIVGSGTNAALQTSPRIWGRPSGDEVYGISANSGRRIWSFKTVGQDMPTPVVVGPQAIFSTGDWYAYSVATINGVLAWSTPLYGRTTMGSATSDDFGHVFISTCRSTPYRCNTTAINAATGKIIWDVPYGGSDCSPTLDGSHIFVSFNSNAIPLFQYGGSDGVIAINTRSGAIDWVWNGPSGPYNAIGTQERQISGVVKNGILYQPVPTLPGLVAFDDDTGRVLWRFRTWAPVKMSPVIVTNHLIFGDTGGILYSLSTQGTLTHTMTFLRPFSSSAPIVSGASLLIANDRSIYSLPLGPLLK